MKTLIILIQVIVICLSMSNVFGQEITSIDYQDEMILEKIKSLENQRAAKIFTENVILNTPVTLETQQDSAQLLPHMEVNTTLKSIRYDPEIIISIFPELVNLDKRSNYYVDYQSLITILCQALAKQQQQIDLLNLRVNELLKNQEESINRLY